MVFVPKPNQALSTGFSQHEIENENVKYITFIKIFAMPPFVLAAKCVKLNLLFSTEGGPGNVFCNALKK